MSFVYFLRKFFRRPCPPCPPRINALESSSLGQLPVELILHITRLLDPVSAASFSLCCRPISLIIEGTQYLNALRHEDRQSELYAFLTLLEPELPDQVLCYYCRKFHAIKNAREYIYNYLPYYNSTGRQPPKCFKADVKSGACYISQNLSWTVFQMAMKRYRQGRDYTGLLVLMSFHLMNSREPGHVRHITDSFRVSNGSLLSREQRVYLPFRGEGDEWWACPHNTTIVRFDDYLRDGMKHWNEPESREAALMQCEFCLTEFRLDFKAIDGEGVAMGFTKWQNLGRGLFPWDLEWRSHIHHPGTGKRLWKRVRFERGSISVAFEEGKDFDFELASLLSSLCF